MNKIEIDIDKLSRDVRSFSDGIVRIKSLREDEPLDIKHKGDEAFEGLIEYGRYLNDALCNYRKMRSEIRDVISCIKVE